MPARVPVDVAGVVVEDDPAGVVVAVPVIAASVPIDVVVVVVPDPPDEPPGVVVTTFTFADVSAGVAFLGGVGGALPETKDICPFTMLTCVFEGSPGLYW